MGLLNGKAKRPVFGQFAGKWRIGLVETFQAAIITPGVMVREMEMLFTYWPRTLLGCSDMM